MRKKKRKDVQKKELIDAPSVSNIRTVVEEHVSSENVHSAGLWWSSYMYIAVKQTIQLSNYPSSKKNKSWDEIKEWVAIATPTHSIS